MEISEIKIKLIRSVKIESYPKRPTGGQTCGVSPRGIKLSCPETGFEIAINNYRSEFQNRELCITFFRLYLDEVIKQKANSGCCWLFAFYLIYLSAYGATKGSIRGRGL